MEPAYENEIIVQGRLQSKVQGFDLELADETKKSIQRVNLDLKSSLAKLSLLEVYKSPWDELLSNPKSLQIMPSLTCDRQQLHDAHQNLV